MRIHLLKLKDIIDRWANDNVPWYIALDIPHTEIPRIDNLEFPTDEDGKPNDKEAQEIIDAALKAESEYIRDHADDLYEAWWTAGTPDRLPLECPAHDASYQKLKPGWALRQPK